MSLRRPLWCVVLAAAVASCDDGSIDQQITNPGGEASLDVQVRQAVNGWGVVPILPLNAPDPALVDLGRMLFFDKLLSGNRDVSCSTCHSPLSHSGDDRSLAVGTAAIMVGGVRQLGPGRQFTPRNAPSLFNAALGAQYMFWDGRVAEDMGLGRFRVPPGINLPTGLSSLLATQAMLPVTNRVEMRGNAGDRDVFGNANEIAALPDTANAAIWDAVMKRVLAVPAYVEKFRAAFPFQTQFGFQHAANAIAAFEAATFTKTNTGFDRFLRREDAAMSVDAKRGAVLFFGVARCSTCHNGPMLGAQSFANGGVPQIGPGTGAIAPLDGGREDEFGRQVTPQFFFRVAPLRNVELSAPYMHNGVYSTLEAVVRHYNNADSALRAFDPSELDPALRGTYHGDGATISKMQLTMDGRLRGPLLLTLEQQAQLVAFLKSLTDPSAKDMSASIPAAVPSGLPVR